MAHRCTGAADSLPASVSADKLRRRLTGRGDRDFVGEILGSDPALESLDACAGYLRHLLPLLSLQIDDAWRRMAELTYATGPGERFHSVWDTRTAGLLTGPMPGLWALFGVLAHVSGCCLLHTAARMRSARPDMEVVTLPGTDHAPILTEPPV